MMTPQVMLTDLADAALGSASKQNLLEFFLSLRRAPSVEFAERDGLSRWLTHVPHPWFNGIYLGRAPSPDDRRFLDESIRHFAEHHVTPFTCWIDASVDRGAWHGHLSDLGFLYDSGAPGMAMALGDLPPALALPNGFEIQRVVSDSDLETWCRTFIEGYELPTAWYGGLHLMMGGLGVGYPLAHYLGMLEGEPVATSSVFHAAGVAGVQFVATAPRARRQGLGGLITLHPLYEARARGFAAAILQSSQMGYSVYERVGFRKVADVDNYYHTR